MNATDRGKIVLTHPFIGSCNDPYFLFDGKMTIAAFHYRIEALATNEAAIEFDFQVEQVTKDLLLSEEQKVEAIHRLNDLKEEFFNKFKGDCFEVFNEYLMNTMGYHPMIGVHKYQVVNAEEDWGVDGFGIGNNGKPITIQAKFRNSAYELRRNPEKLGNFADDSYSIYGVDTNPHYDGNMGTEVHNMLVVTTGKGFHHSILNRPNGTKMRILNYEGLCVLVNDNEVFWMGFQEAWRRSFEQEED